MNERIYFDNNATTPLDPKVIAAMHQDLCPIPSNPSSYHYFGRRAKKMLDDSRKKVASFISASPSEVIFTSGGTESINMAVRGITASKSGGHIITSSVEHHAVLYLVDQLEKKGFTSTKLQPGIYGAVNPKAVKDALRNDTCLIVLMGANNETGVLTDIVSIADIAYSNDIPFIVDNVGLLGKAPLYIPQGVSAACFSGHKCHGPKGCGFLYLAKGTTCSPLIVGGGQEFYLRAGTENLTAILGLAEAISLLDKSHYDTIASLRNHFENQLLELIPDTIVNGEGPRISNTSNIAFPGVDAETLVIALDQQGIAVSHGSACSAGALEPSHVLLGMGFPLDHVRSSIRFSFSRMNTIKEIDQALLAISSIVTSLRC